LIVLDTHALVWWINGQDQLSTVASRAIEHELAGDKHVLVSVISAWEIAMLVGKGRLVITMDVDEWLATIASIDGVVFVPVDLDVAVHSVRLPGDFHPDPADRMIVALARHHAAPLVTADARIQGYRHVQTVW
jgi:PIN domain nuclease of toxin-antitoxin system